MRWQFIAEIVVAAGVTLVCILTAAARHPSAPPRLSIEPRRIWADGYDSAILTIDAPDGVPPRVSIASGSHSARVEEVERDGGHWKAPIRAGVMPGPIPLRVEAPGAPPVSITVMASLRVSDRFEDGTPDFLRLEEERDQRAFRRWFTYLAEAQYFQAPAARPREIDDCAALIRYAYREALHAHDAAWAASAKLPVTPPFDSVTKYEYPYTALGAALFRLKPGPFRVEDLSNGAFAQFADAKTLWRFNTYLVSRDLPRALPGDLLFYRQRRETETYHSMIFLGPSQIGGQNTQYILYHTGPEGNDPGDMRRLTVEQLMAFPENKWRPDPGNPSFLGVYRWNILKRGEAHP